MACRTILWTAASLARWRIMWRKHGMRALDSGLSEWIRGEHGAWRCVACCTRVSAVNNVVDFLGCELLYMVLACTATSGFIHNALSPACKNVHAVCKQSAAATSAGIRPPDVFFICDRADHQPIYNLALLYSNSCYTATAKATQQQAEATNWHQYYAPTETCWRESLEVDSAAAVSAAQARIVDASSAVAAPAPQAHFRPQHKGLVQRLTLLHLLLLPTRRLGCALCIARLRFCGAAPKIWAISGAACVDDSHSTPCCDSSAAPFVCSSSSSKSSTACS